MDVYAAIKEAMRLRLIVLPHSRTYVATLNLEN